MKITLHSPPDGYEAEADFHCDWLRIGQHVMTNPYNGPFIVTRSHLEHGATTHIVLTPKKRRYRKLYPVDTFEEATKSRGNPKYALAVCDQDEVWLTANSQDPDTQWMRRTEHEE